MAKLARRARQDHRVARLIKAVERVGADLEAIACVNASELRELMEKSQMVTGKADRYGAYARRFQNHTGKTRRVE